MSNQYYSTVELQFGEIKQLFISKLKIEELKTKSRRSGNIRKQALFIMDNLKNVIESSGYSMNDIVDVNISLTDMADFDIVNEVYENYFFRDNYPIQSTLEVKELVSGRSVEIDAIAMMKIRESIL